MNPVLVGQYTYTACESPGPYSSVPGWKVKQVQGEDFGDAMLEGPVTYAGLRFTRAGSTLAIVVLVLALMTVLTLLGVLVSLVVFREAVQLERLLIGGAIVLFATIYAQRHSEQQGQPLRSSLE